LTESPLYLDENAGVNLMDVHFEIAAHEGEHGLTCGESMTCN